MSKSVGNVIDPLALIEAYGTDAFRYFFARHIPTFDDGDFTFEKFENAYNNELANDLGNLVSRVSKMIEKYCDGVVGGSDEFSFDATAYDKAFIELNYNRAIEAAWELVQHLNKYIDETRPFEKAKDDPEAVQAIMNYLAAGLAKASTLLMPFIPDTAEKIAKVFDVKPGEKIGKLDDYLFSKKYNYTESPWGKN
jgi:methionyl-tRNA synthetase